MSRQASRTFASPRNASRDGDGVVHGDAELAAALSSARICVRSVDRHFRIDTQANACDLAASGSQIVDEIHLAFRLGVYQLHARVERFFDFASGLANSAKHDVARAETSSHGEVQFASGHYVRAGTQRAQQPQQRQAPIGFDAVVDPVRQAGQRRVERLILTANRVGSVHVYRSADCTRDPRQRRCIAPRLAAHGWHGRG